LVRFKLYKITLSSISTKSELHVIVPHLSFAMSACKLSSSILVSSSRVIQNGSPRHLFNPLKHIKIIVVLRLIAESSFRIIYFASHWMPIPYIKLNQQSNNDKACLCSTIACLPSTFHFWPTTYPAHKKIRKVQLQLLSPGCIELPSQRITW